jgi:site-specific DNA-methyltransferase (adenine-specific)
MTLIKLICGDCREVMETFKENSFDSIVTDPPYELKFMGKKWDGSGISYDEKVWKECLRVLKPGGYLLAFGGSRTYHRLACKIEDVGFELHPLIGWCYGSGFPKATNLSKQIDKSTKDINGQLTKKWDGWYYGKQSLKPALEPICMAQKPPDGKMVLNIEKWECGAMNIDASRIGTKDTISPSGETVTTNCHQGYQRPNASMFNTGKPKERGGPANPSGRWPANLILGHAPGCVRRGESNWDCVEGCAVRLIAEQSGHLKSGKVKPYKNNGGWKQTSDFKTGSFEASEGTAARFFFQVDPDPLFYCAKASKKERGENNSHPTVKPLKLMKYLVRLVTPPGGTVLDPFAGSGTTLLAAKEENFNAVGIELDNEYIKIAIERGCGMEL